MATLPESVERALAADLGKNYCADCLAQAAGFTLAEELVALTKLMRTGHKKARDRVVEKGECSVCGRIEPIVRLGS